MQYLTNFLGDNKPLLYFAAAVLVIIFVMLLVALYRFLFGPRIRTGGLGRARQPRLGVVDAFDLDRQRQLVLVRRDNVEHLVMIGGPNDVLIESAIVRAQPAIAPPGRETGGLAPPVAALAPEEQPAPSLPPAPPAIAPPPRAPEPPPARPPEIITAPAPVRPPEVVAASPPAPETVDVAPPIAAPTRAPPPPRPVTIARPIPRPIPPPPIPRPAPKPVAPPPEKPELEVAAPEKAIELASAHEVLPPKAVEPEPEPTPAPPVEPPPPPAPVPEATHEPAESPKPPQGAAVVDPLDALEQEMARLLNRPPKT